MQNQYRKFILYMNNKRLEDEINKTISFTMEAKNNIDYLEINLTKDVEKPLP